MTVSSGQKLPIATGPFEPSWESLRSWECPAWFRDAKLGFWSHWGPQSVPMYGDWYARHMYVPGHDQYRHHWRVYGHPSQTGYQDIVPLWRAEKFDPEGLMRLFAAAGGKYFVAQAVHHDNFDNWDSRHQRWNSVNVGPKRDIMGAWRDAARSHGLPFGFSEHLGASFNWFATSKDSDPDGPYAGVPYDGNDAALADLYHANRGYTLRKGEELRWYTDNQDFPRHWFERIKDAIDRYEPELVYSDGGVPYGQYGLDLIAHLYNTSAARNGANQAVYTQKDSDPLVHSVGVLDIERGQMSEIAERPWQTDTSTGDWYYNVRDVYKTPRQVLESLVDIVSKNGNLLLNVPQRPDGTLDDEGEHLLRRMAAWVEANGEGIFGSRPYDVAGEGQAELEAGAFKEAAVEWTAADFRFTRNGNTVYAYQMRRSDDAGALIRTLGSGGARRVAAVRLLGHGPVEWQQTDQGLRIVPPRVEAVEGPIGFAVEQQ